MSKISLFTNQTENGNSAAFNAIGNPSNQQIVETFLTIFGVFDGASLQLQYKASDGNYYSTGDDPIISACAYMARVNTSTSYRWSLTNAGASTDISADAFNATASS